MYKLKYQHWNIEKFDEILLFEMPMRTFHLNN